jgi:hypothetical protein
MIIDGVSQNSRLKQDMPSRPDRHLIQARKDQHLGRLTIDSAISRSGGYAVLSRSYWSPDPDGQIPGGNSVIPGHGQW